MPFPYLWPFVWDNISQTLLDHEADHSYTPYIHIQLTKTGETTYNYYTTDRILQIDIHQDPYRDDGIITLANYDQHFKDIDLEDYKVVINFGLTISGVNYTNAIAPQWVKAQSFISEEGKLYCKLILKGILSSLKDDESQGFYTGSGTAKSIIDQILKATLPCYSHCTPWEVIWHGDTGLDSINIYAPSDAFLISLGDNRLNSVRQLLDLDISFMRPEADDKIHIRRPKLSGTDYDHQFALDGHVFFWSERHDDLLIPSYVYVECKTTQNPPYDDPVTYSGYAQDDEAYGLYPVKYFQKAYDLNSNQEATDIAEGVLANIRQSQTKGSVQVPMSFYSQIGDYIKITDTREGSETVCNIGSIDWHYEAGGGKYRQILGVGGWWNRRKAMGFMQDYFEKPIKRDFPFWMTVNLPATKLLAGQWIIIQAFTIPNYRRLFIKHYSAIGQPDYISEGDWEVGVSYVSGDKVTHGVEPYLCKLAHTSSAANEPGVGAEWATYWTLVSGNLLHFATWDGASWTPIESHGYSYYIGAIKEVYDAYGDTPFAFIISNGSGVVIPRITASVAWDTQYLGGSLP